MRKLAAVAIMLALPALVAADINRFNPDRDLERPDAVLWRVQRPEPGLTAMTPVLPVWKGAGVPLVNVCQSRVACPSAAPQHVTRCLPSPDCRNNVSAPVLWPHAPRVDEVKTTAEERRLDRALAPDGKPAN